MEPDRARRILQEGLRQVCPNATADQAEALLEFSILLAEWSERMNLTGHRGLEAILSRLVLEAAALSTALPETESLADLGSGAGIPGLPLAILRPACRITLVEARERRHHFQRAAIRHLNLENAEPRLGRVEDLEPEAHAAVVAQAMAPPIKALDWMLPWARSGGILAIPGSAAPPLVPEHADVVSETVVPYRAPAGPDRTLWIGRRR